VCHSSSNNLRLRRTRHLNREIGKEVVAGEPLLSFSPIKMTIIVLETVAATGNLLEMAHERTEVVAVAGVVVVVVAKTMRLS